MSSNLYKKIIFITISFVVLGHFAIQANALEKKMSHATCDSGIHTKECIRNLDLNICNSIETKEVQTSSKYFVSSDGYNFYVLTCENNTKEIYFSDGRENSLISYSQLARSHLS